MLKCPTVIIDSELTTAIRHGTVLLFQTVNWVDAVTGSSPAGAESSSGTYQTGGGGAACAQKRYDRSFIDLFALIFFWKLLYTLLFYTLIPATSFTWNVEFTCEFWLLLHW